MIDYTPKAKKPKDQKFCTGFWADHKYAAKKVDPVVKTLNTRETKNLPSKVTPGGSTAKVEPKKYTGDKMLGIATSHKSNLIPVFNDQAAKDLAQMRR